MARLRRRAASSSDSVGARSKAATEIPIEPARAPGRATAALAWLAALLGAGIARAQADRAAEPDHLRHVARGVDALAAKVVAALSDDAFEANVLLAPTDLVTALAAAAAVRAGEPARRRLLGDWGDGRRQRGAVVGAVAELFARVAAAAPSAVERSALVVTTRPATTVPAPVRSRLADAGVAVEHVAGREALLARTGERAPASIAAPLPAWCDTVAITSFAGRWDWRHPFDAERTKVGWFWPDPDTRTNTTFLSTTRTMRLGADDERQIVQLPLKADGMVVELVLPRDHLSPREAREMLADLVAGAAARPKFARTEVTLVVPSVDARSELNLSPYLRDASGPAADDLAIEGRHRARLRMDERGIGMSTTTRVAAGPSATDAVVVKIVRPFVLLVRHEPTDLVVFAGFVRTPQRNDRSR